MQFSAETAVTEEALIKCVNVFSMVSPLTDDEKEGVIRELHSRLAVRIDRGACVREKNHTLGTTRQKHPLHPLFGIAIACISRRSKDGMPNFWTSWIVPRMRSWIFWETPNKRKAFNAGGFA